MPSAPDKVALLRPGPSFLKDQFVPPVLPPLLELRKTMGLTFDEAAGVLLISADSLRAKEADFSPLPHPYSMGSVRLRYLYFISQCPLDHKRNIVRDHLTLQQIRYDIFYFDLALMGNMYGGYTARQWYNFEMNEVILPRNILMTIDQDVYRMQTRNFDQV